MTTIQQIFDFIDSFAPFDTALPDDNPGLLVGGGRQQVTGIAVVLDITAQSIDQAIRQNCNLIISHHPVIFRPLCHINAGSIPHSLIRNGLNAICAHTNLDAAAGGVNDALAAALGLSEIESLSDPKTPGKPPIARVGTLPSPMNSEQLAQYAKAKLGTAAVRFTEGGKPVTRVAVCGGAGTDLIHPAIDGGAQALITGDVRHHEFLEARHNGFTLIDAGHFETEVVVVKPLCEQLKARFPELPVVVIAESPAARTV